jgi:triosephosphate isomerase
VTVKPEGDYFNMRTPIIAGNWKMYKTLAEAVQLAHEIREVADKGE